MRRWIKNDGLPALKEKKPTLILGPDLADFLGARKKSKTKLCLSELFCFRCRCPQSSAGNMLDYVPRTPLMGRVTGFCAVCETVMHKAFSAARVPDLCRIAEVSFPHGGAHLSETSKPIVNDHYRKEPKP